MLGVINIERLVSRVRKEGLSQNELAKAVGVSQQLIGEIETGRTRSTKAIFKIARIFGTAPTCSIRISPSLESLSAKINEDLKDLDEQDAVHLLQGICNDIEFAKTRKPLNERLNNQNSG